LRSLPLVFEMSPVFTSSRHLAPNCAVAALHLCIARVLWAPGDRPMLDQAENREGAAELIAQAREAASAADGLLGEATAACVRPILDCRRQRSPDLQARSTPSSAAAAPSGARAWSSSCAPTTTAPSAIAGSTKRSPPCARKCASSPTAR